MKISSSKSENTSSQQLSQETISSASPNDAVFNQILLLLSQQMPMPDNTSAAQVPSDATTPLEQNSVNNNNNINQLLSNLQNAAASETHQGDKQSNIDLLAKQLADSTGNSDHADIVSLLNSLSMQQPSNEQAASSTKLNGSSLINNKLNNLNQVDMDNVKQIVDKNLINQAITINNPSQDENNSISTSNNSLAQMIANTLNQNQEKRAISSTSEMAAMQQLDFNKINAQFNHPAQVDLSSISVESINKANNNSSSILTMSNTTDDSSKALQISSLPVIPFELSNKLNIDQNDKHVNALMNFAQFINHQTSQLPMNNNAQSTTTTQTSNSTMSASNNFDPMHDFKLDISSTSINSQLKEIYDAKIKIYPPELGHIVAKLKLDKSNAELVILTENNHVKQIVESNLSLLKEHFQNADIQLTQIDVQTSQSNDRGQENNSRREQFFSDEHSSNELNQVKKPEKSINKPSNTIVDTYA